MNTENNSKYDINSNEFPAAFQLPEVNTTPLTPEQTAVRDKVAQGKAVWKETDEFMKVISNPAKYMSREPQNGMNSEYYNAETYLRKKDRLLKELTQTTEYFQNLERNNDGNAQFTTEQRKQIQDVAVALNLKLQELKQLAQPGEKLQTSVTPDFMSQVRRLFSRAKR